MKKIRVNVTAKDIREGERGERRRCPVARAMSRKLQRPVRAYTASFDCIRPRAGTWTERLPLPHRVYEWIQRFDEDQQPVRPFRFTVSIPR